MNAGRVEVSATWCGAGSSNLHLDGMIECCDASEVSLEKE